MRTLTIVILMVLFSLAFTWQVVSWSEMHGKLAVPPDYDDSHSLVEGAVRLLNVQKDGWAAGWNEYQLRNPHSFLHYYWTAALFAIFGIHEAVPYWANGLFLLGILGAFITMLPRGLAGIWKLVWVAAFLGVPICFHVVFDFRSEVTMAALLFIGCACAIEWSWGSSRPGFWFAATGICFALALAMKPVMFPYQLGILGLCSFIYLVSRFVISGDGEIPGRRISIRIGQKFAKAILWIVALWGIAILPNLTHFWIYRAEIFGYIIGVAFESDFYKLNESQGAQWAFHWLGYSGVWHLGGLNILFAVLLGSGILCRFLPALRNFAPDFRWLSLSFLVLGAFGGIAINSVHQPWFGMTFQLLLLSAALSFLSSLASNPRLPAWGFPAFLFLLCIFWWQVVLNRWFLLLCLAAGGVMLGGVLLRRWSLVRGVSLACAAVFAALCWRTTQIAPYHNYVQRTMQEAGADGLKWRREGPERVFHLLKEHWTTNEPPIIWSANFGWVDGNSLSWMAVQDGLPWKIYTAGTIFSKPGEVPGFADFLVVPSPGITGEISTPDGVQNWDERIRNEPNWRLVGDVEAPEGRVSIYQNNLPVSHRDFSASSQWIKFLSANQ